MFHQICLLPQDKALLHFLWHGLNREASPSVYEWQVLHFGTTCSPCCAIYALQRLVQDAQAGEDIAHSVNNCFYVENCLQSLPTAESAKSLIENLRIILALGGFEIHQWASNDPDVIQYLPSEARSEQTELTGLLMTLLLTLQRPPWVSSGTVFLMFWATNTEPLSQLRLPCVTYIKYLQVIMIICATSFLLLLELRLLFGICGTKHVIGMTPTYLMSS